MVIRLNILVKLRAHDVQHTCEIISEIGGVIRTDRIAGAYDVIAYAELKSVNELKKLMDRLYQVPGFLHADTCLALEAASIR